MIELSVDYQDDFELDKYSVINHPEEAEATRKRARSLSFEAYAAHLHSQEGSASEFDMRSPLPVIREEATTLQGGGPPACKICLSEEEPGNPLLSPCNCTGSVRYVHLHCIREWLESKKRAHQSASTHSYVWEGIECELCKDTYQTFVVNPQTGSEVCILKFVIPRDTQRYIILESIHSCKSVKIMHVVKFLEGQRMVNVGRSVEDGLRINDESVSPNHALFRIYNVYNDKIKSLEGKIALIDNKSKYGTYLLMTHPVAVKPGVDLTFQVGSSLLRVLLEDRYGCAEQYCCYKHLWSSERSQPVSHFESAKDLLPIEFQAQPEPVATPEQVLM